MADSNPATERMSLFLTGWRYVTTPEQANALPTSSIAVVDDAFLWDADTSDEQCKPELRSGYWDGVVEIAKSDRIHNCERGWKNCEQAECRIEWFEPEDTRGQSLPPLPFFAWHPTFCGGDA